MSAIMVGGVSYLEIKFQTYFFLFSVWFYFKLLLTQEILKIVSFDVISQTELLA